MGQASLNGSASAERVGQLNLKKRRADPNVHLYNQKPTRKRTEHRACHNRTWTFSQGVLTKEKKTENRGPKRTNRIRWLKGDEQRDLMGTTQELINKLPERTFR